MSLRAYTVKKDIGDAVFNCYDPQEWFDRLSELGKFDNGVWMEITEEELQEMETNTQVPLSEEEREIIADIRAAMGDDDTLYLEYF